MSLITERARPAHQPELVPEDHVIVLFGATGDLARRKLPPGLYRLAKAGLLPRRYQIVATSRGEMSDAEFRAFAYRAVAEFSDGGPDDDTWATFADTLADIFAELCAEYGALKSALVNPESS